MKILALSDLHGDTELVKKMAVLAEKEKVDLVTLAGDIFDQDNHVDGMIGPFKDKGLEVAILPGNHEGLAHINFLCQKYKIKNLHGYSIRIGDIGIFGCGYADVGPHQLTEQEFFKTLKDSHETIKDTKRKIMVTHIHPDKSIFGFGVFPGSSGVRKALDEFQPDIHICGHIHETEGIEEVIGNTKVINVGKKGRIIEIS